MRYLIVGQSSADTAHRLGQTLEASSRLGTAPEDLALWLSRMEKELGEQESQQDGQEPSVTASDREKVWDTGLPEPLTIPTITVCRGSLVWVGRGGSWHSPGGLGCAGCPCPRSAALVCAHPPWLTSVPPLQFEQVLESQLTRVAGLGERLEEIGRVQLDAEALRSQLSEQKVGLQQCPGVPGTLAWHPHPAGSCQDLAPTCGSILAALRRDPALPGPG